MTRVGDDLVDGHRLLGEAVLFGRELRAAGLAVDLGAAVDFARALNVVDVGEREQVRAAGSAVFVRRHDDGEVYDIVFDRFWRRRQSPLDDLIPFAESASARDAGPDAGDPQGEAGDELYLVLDGMFAVEVDGKQVAEIGPGAIVGERAILESGNRTATLRALTPCRVASVPRRYADGKELIDIAAGHRREEAR